MASVPSRHDIGSRILEYNEFLGNGKGIFVSEEQIQLLGTEHVENIVT